MDNIYNINIERVVLSSILFSQDIESVLDILKPEDFYLPAHQNIFEVMETLYKSDLPMDEDFIRKRVDSKDVDDSILIEILSANPVTNSFVYCKEIKEASKKRQLLSLCTLIKMDALEKEELSDNIIVDIKKEIEKIENDDIFIDEDIDGDQILKMEFPTVPVYEIGIEPIDTQLGAIANGQLIYVIGLEETGKTHVTYKAMENLSVARKVGIISLEFGKEKYKKRLQQMISKGHKLIPKNIKAAFNCHDISKLERTIRKWHKDGVNFFVIDSINLIENYHIKDRFERILDIGTRLFKLMQQLNITLFVISTSTKEDNKKNVPSIYGGQLLNNFCDGKWMIMRNFNSGERILWVTKNKQNYLYPKISLFFHKDGSISGAPDYMTGESGGRDITVVEVPFVE